MSVPPIPSDVQAAYDDFDQPTRAALLKVRQLVFEVAQSNPVVGEIHETLKWGQPSYLTPKTKSGSTIRLASSGTTPDTCGIYLNCNTTLISQMRDIYPDAFTYQGSRAALFAAGDPPHPDVLAHVVEMALTYHRRK